MFQCIPMRKWTVAFVSRILLDNAKLPIARGILGAEVEETESWYFNNFVLIFLLLVLPLAPEE